MSITHFYWFSVLKLDYFNSKFNLFISFAVFFPKFYICCMFFQSLCGVNEFKMEIFFLLESQNDPELAITAKLMQTERGVKLMTGITVSAAHTWAADAMKCKKSMRQENIVCAATTLASYLPSGDFREAVYLICQGLIDYRTQSVPMFVTAIVDQV